MNRPLSMTKRPYGKAKGKRQKPKGKSMVAPRPLSCVCHSFTLTFGIVVPPHFCLLPLAAARVSASHAIFCLPTTGGLVASDAERIVTVLMHVIGVLALPGV